MKRFVVIVIAIGLASLFMFSCFANIDDVAFPGNILSMKAIRTLVPWRVDEERALVFACFGHNVSMLKYLISTGVDVNLTVEGECLMDAVIGGLKFGNGLVTEEFFTTVDLLVEEGFDLHKFLASSRKCDLICIVSLD